MQPSFSTNLGFPGIEADGQGDDIALAFLGFTLLVVLRFTNRLRAGNATASAMENAYE